ncbi:unknown [Clostridium sp. CAG:575]|nr:unknown [Clostridium sp. CAG:575]
MCQDFVYDYINKIEEIVEKGMEKGQIKKGNSKAIASEIYALIASTLVYKMKNGNEIDVLKLYKEFDRTLVEGLKVDAK